MPLLPLPSLLAVFAHPDDESLSAGGMLAQHAASGARTGVDPRIPHPAPRTPRPTLPRPEHFERQRP